MKYKAPGKCPVCNEKLHITKLACPRCATTIEGAYEPSAFNRLDEDEMNFLQVFIACRGNIKDVEKVLGISYPTVRSKLDNIIALLDYQLPTPRPSKEDLEAKKTAKAAILEELSAGTISAAEAKAALENL